MRAHRWLNKQNFARAFLLSSALAFAAVLWFAMQASSYVDPQGLDISGEWDFYNGKMSVDAATGLNIWPQKVNVPKQLPDEIRNNLAAEYWYRRTIQLPRALRFSGETLNISLGNIKGEHEIYWDGKFIGAGSKSTLANYRIPSELLSEKNISITVRVKKTKAIFPGIVQISPILIGRATFLEKQMSDFYFHTVVKPLLPGILKFILFFLFLTIYSSTPMKKEYFTFAFFSLFSAAESFSHSGIFPFRDDQLFKTSLFFLFSVCALSMMPSLTANFLRADMTRKYWAKIYGMSLVVFFIGSAVLLKKAESLFVLFEYSNRWLPLISLVPCGVFSLAASYKLAFKMKIPHRAIQVAAFAFFLFLGALVWSSGAANLFQFKIFYSELVDILVFAGLTFCLATDLHFLTIQSERAGELVPKWFTFLLSTRTESAVFEVPMIVIAVDTVGYTKHLSTFGEEGKQKYHEQIRNALHVVLKDYSAQKISERGDGAIFAWELPLEKIKRKEAINSALGAAKFLSNTSENISLKFRVGMAAGSVRCEWRKGELSFLGEALNAAARLEGLANPGTVLVHESVVGEIEGGLLEQDWISIELKGVLYRAKFLQEAA